VKEGRILYLVFFLLREDLLEDGDEVSFVRMLEEGRLLSLMEAEISLIRLIKILATALL
jgi:hypothetical protein